MGYALVLIDENELSETSGRHVFEFGDFNAPLEMETIGLSQETARDILTNLQHRVVDIQNEKLSEHARDMVCTEKGLKLKDYRTRKIDTLFGRVEIRIPRLRNRKGRIFPVSGWPAYQRATPALEGAIIRLGAWMSYRAGCSILSDFYPITDGASLKTAWRKLLASGENMEEGPVQSTCHARRVALSLDTTFIRSTHRDPSRGYEILIGQAENNTGRRGYFGAMFGDKKAAQHSVTRALHHVGRTTRTAVTAFTDGAESLRRFCRTLGLKAKPLLDWFHIAMRIQHVSQAALGLSAQTPEQKEAKENICIAIDRMRRKLWHGHKDALSSGMGKVREVLHHYQGERKYLYQPAPSRKVWAGLSTLEQYVSNQEAYTVNYARRHRDGKRVGTSMSESAAAHLVNARMNRKQSMRWSKNGAHCLLQVRAAEFDRVYNNAEINLQRAA